MDSQFTKPIIRDRILIEVKLSGILFSYKRLEKECDNMMTDFIDFPLCEYQGYQQRINENKVIYTTRVSDEVGKYKKNQVYNSYFGKLKVIFFKHLKDIQDHPFYHELNKQQIDEISLYIKENGYDVIGLIKI